MPWIERKTTSGAIIRKELHDHSKAPPVEPVLEPLSRVDFLDLFTEAEIEAVLTAADQNKKIAVWLEYLRLAGSVKLDSKRLKKGLRAMERAGILGEGRAVEILAGG